MDTMAYIRPDIYTLVGGGAGWGRMRVLAL